MSLNTMSPEQEQRCRDGLLRDAVEKVSEQRLEIRRLRKLLRAALPHVEHVEALEPLGESHTRLGVLVDEIRAALQRKP